MKKTFQMRCPQEVLDALKVVAEEQNTTVTRVVLKLILREIKQHQNNVLKE